MILLLTIVLVGLVHCTGAIGECKAFHEPEEDPIVITPLGKYRGSIMKNPKDEPFFAFRSVRYAEPPIGELRFKPAVPIKKHDGVQDATKEPPMCPQVPIEDEFISEDCLFLNIYIKELPSHKWKLKKPVIVVIHGGDFEKLSSRSDIIGPQYMMIRDVVLVTFNYRLGALGFVSTGDEHAPGNLGMKDQVLVLKWIRDNIEAFGGDPKSVTLFGSGAGATSANLHFVSPLSKGLFHKAILGSATALGHRAVGKSLQKLTRKLARVVGCPDDSSERIMNCLRTIPADTLGMSTTKLGSGKGGRLLWQPVIEGNFAQERFLTDHPEKLISEGKFEQVPIDMGYLSDQYSDIAIRLVQDKEKLEKLDTEWNKEAPELFLYKHDEKRDIISKKLRSFYFKDKKIDESSLPQLIKIFNDALAGHEMIRGAKLISANSKKTVFFYYFTWRGKYSFFNPPEGPVPNGPVLYDDIIYIFPVQRMFPLIKKDEPEFALVDAFTKDIEHFAHTGNPMPPHVNETVKWEPYNVKTQKYLFSGEKDLVKEKLNEHRLAKWEKLFPDYAIVEDASNL